MTAITLWMKTTPMQAPSATQQREPHQSPTRLADIPSTHLSEVPQGSGDDGSQFDSRSDAINDTAVLGRESAVRQSNDGKRSFLYKGNSNPRPDVAVDEPLPREPDSLVVTTDAAVAEPGRSRSSVTMADEQVNSSTDAVEREFAGEAVKVLVDLSRSETFVTIGKYETSKDRIARIEKIDGMSMGYRLEPADGLRAIGSVSLVVLEHPCTALQVRMLRRGLAIQIGVSLRNDGFGILSVPRLSATVRAARSKQLRCARQIEKLQTQRNELRFGENTTQIPYGRQMLRRQQEAVRNIIKRKQRELGSPVTATRNCEANARPLFALMDQIDKKAKVVFHVGRKSN